MVLSVKCNILLNIELYIGSVVEITVLSEMKNKTETETDCLQQGQNAEKM